jgi:hypothetical protein
MLQMQQLPYTQCWHLTDAQVASITSSYWISLMSPESQAALAARKKQ